MATRQSRVRGASHELVSAARTLRRQQTTAEALLWNALRGRQVDGFKFRRQHPIGRYVLDFVCVEQKLVVELDGRHHELDEQARHDLDRTAHLEQFGYRVVRFGNEMVLYELPRVLDRIRFELERAVDGG